MVRAPGSPLLEDKVFQEHFSKHSRGAGASVRRREVKGNWTG